MTFELWSIWHILYICSPFVIFFIIYSLVKKQSDKVKSIVGYVLGGLSIFILLARNVDIFARNGWDAEVVPLQVCHLGSIIAGLALIFKNKCLMLITFCFHMIPAFLAMIFADALANYDTILKIRPQTYIWGHIVIIVCALYAILVYRPNFEKRDLIKSIAIVGVMALVAIFCNSLFRKAFDWTPNYFYLFNYKGTPLKFLYTAVPSSRYGWFEINWFYTIVLLVFFIGVFIGLYFIAKIIAKIKPHTQKDVE